MLCHTKGKSLIPPPVFSPGSGSAFHASNNWNHFSPFVCLGPRSSRAAGQHKPGCTTGIPGTAFCTGSGWGMTPKIHGLALLCGSEQLRVQRSRTPLANPAPSKGLENSSPVLKQHRNTANAQTAARELPGRLILATNPGELQKLPVNSNPETFQNTFFPEESRGAACIFSNIHQRTGPSHTFKSRPRKYGKAEIILGSNPGTCHSACRTSYE